MDLLILLISLSLAASALMFVRRMMNSTLDEGNEEI